MPGLRRRGILGAALTLLRWLFQLQGAAAIPLTQGISQSSLSLRERASLEYRVVWISSFLRRQESRDVASNVVKISLTTQIGTLAFTGSGTSRESGLTIYCLRKSQPFAASPGTAPLAHQRAGRAGNLHRERTARMRIPVPVFTRRRVGRVIVALAAVGLILVSTVASHGCRVQGHSPSSDAAVVSSE